MEIKWTYPIIDENFVPWDYLCQPIYWNDKLFYAISKIDAEVKNGDHLSAIYVLVIDNAGVLVNSRKVKFETQNKSGEIICPTKNWFFRILNNQLYLNVGFWLDLNNTEIATVDLPEEFLKSEIESKFYFGDYVVDYNGLSTIQCFSKETRAISWKMKLKGYLYTQIYQKEDFIFFGTAGKGGAFYFINLKTGEILTEFVNQDSSQFIWVEDRVLLRDKSGDLVKLNPMNSEVVGRLKFKDKLFYAPYLKNDDLIYTTVYNSKSGFVKIICFQDF